MTLRLLDTFSGIGGFSLAAMWLGGFKTVQFVEIDPFCRKVLNKHWPNMPIHCDICNFRPEPGFADVIVGGFPCQDISTAGKHAGIKVGTRSGLFYELLRVICVVRPRYVVLENVSAIVNGGMDIVLGALAEAGYDAEWCCIKASDVGACHRRDRWWCVAYPANMLSDGGPSEQQGQFRGRSVPESGDGDGKNAAHPNDQGLEGRQPASVPERRSERLAWPRDPSGGRLNPDWRSYVSEPVICRGDARVPGRVDRLKSLGNAVVPQVAMIPLARVLELELEAHQ